MKIKISMKDPDTLDDAISEAVEDEMTVTDLDEEEAEAVAKIRHQTVKKICAKWFKYGEYLTVVIDTEAQTCTVVPC